MTEKRAGPVPGVPVTEVSVKRELTVNHKGTRMVKDGDDRHGLPTTKLKNLG